MNLLPLLCLLSLWLGPASAQEMRVVTVEEGADAVLPCSSDSEVEEFDWKKENGEHENKEVFLYTGGSHDDKHQDDQFKGRVIFFKDELRAGNASIKINSTKLEDNGTYICVLGPLDKPSKQEFYIRLNVDGVLKIRKVFGAAPKPGFNKLKDSGDWSLLQCEAHGVPKPNVEWRDSSGNVLPPKELKVTESDRRFYVTSELRVTKTDHYTCVVTQKEILHQIHNTIFEDFQVQLKDDSVQRKYESALWIVVAFFIIFVCIAVIGAVLAVRYFRNRLSQPCKIGRSSDEQTRSTPLNSMVKD